jgi:hypothetical protein
MPTTRRSTGGGEAPAPNRTPEQTQQPARAQQTPAQQGRGQQAGQHQPRFVPSHIQSIQQAGGQQPQPQRMPPQAGRLPAQLRQSQGGTAQHVPRGLGAALGQDGPPSPQGAPRQQRSRAGLRAGAFYTGNVLGQWSVNYPSDIWFFDGNPSQWMQLDPSSESGIMLMNEVVSLARAHMLPLYYDTNDSTGTVLDVYTF